MNWLKIKRIDQELPVPKYATDGAGGIDLYSAIDVVIPEGELIKIPTGVAIEIPKNYVGIIYDRSSMAADYYHVHAGVIDSDYRGEIKVMLYNNDNTYKDIKQGQRIAQLLVLPCPQLVIQEVDMLSPTTRMENGFGSTGE